MSIDADGWVTWARRVPGVPDKVYTKRNSMRGVVGHSIVGSIEAALGRFLSTQKEKNLYTNYASASCTFLISYEGELIQMYPIWTSTWTSGGYEINTSFVPIEMEGGLDPFNEPLTDAQVATTMRLAEEFEAYTGRKIVRGTTFREHGEIAREYDYAPTACPSGRYARFYQALEEREMGMTPEEQQAFQEMQWKVALLSKIVIEHGYTVPFRAYDKWPGDDDYKARIIALFPPDATVGTEYKLKEKAAFDYAVLLGLSFAEAQNGTNKAINSHVRQVHVAPTHAHDAAAHVHPEYATPDHLHDEKYAKIGYAHKVVIE